MELPAGEGDFVRSAVVQDNVLPALVRPVRVIEELIDHDDARLVPADRCLLAGRLQAARAFRVCGDTGVVTLVQVFVAKIVCAVAPVYARVASTRAHSRLARVLSGAEQIVVAQCPVVVRPGAH